MQNHSGQKTSLLARSGSENTYKLLQSQYPAEVCFLENGATYRPLRVSLEFLQLLAKQLKKGASHG